VDKYIQELTLSNVLILLGSQEVPKSELFKGTNETEPWYSTKFIQTKVSPQSFGNSSRVYNFTIRPKNEYITNENNIVSCLDEV
jgi:hypothetical protein